jgi:beta-exotoxin I transport system permease protein
MSARALHLAGRRTTAASSALRPQPVRALVARGLADRWRSVLAWGIGGGLMCAFTAGVYPSIEDSLSQALKGYPEGLKDAFSIGELSSVEEYLSAEAFGWIVPIAVSFFAIRSVVRSIAAAEEAGHLDALLAAPVSRRELVGATFLTTAISTVGVLALVALLTFASAGVFGAGLSTGLLLAGAANVWPFAMFFAALALVVTGLRPGPGVITGVAGAVLVAMYVIDLVGKLADPVEFLRHLSLFKYYGMAIRDGIDPLAFAGITGAALLLAACGAWLFDRRDLEG